MTETYWMLVACIIIGIIACVASIVACVIALSLRKRSSGGGASVEQMRIENERVKNELEMSIRTSNSAIAGTLNVQNENYRHLGERVDAFGAQTENKLEKMRVDTYGALSEMKDAITRNINELKSANVESLNKVREGLTQSINEMRTAEAQALKEVRDDNAHNLERVKKDNAEQLEKMRQTVDEKLSSTLESRFNQSFKIVNDRLEEINRTFSELQGLQSGISDLNKIFKNVKTRGTWGEVSLENLLDQILTPEQFAKQVKIKRGSDDVVDFVIKMPGKGDGEVMLPIDAKFPIEDYARLVEASEKADVDGIESANKALANRIKAEAMSIREKYVAPPKTTDFAIMYLPTEGLYAEIIRREGLIEEIQNKYRVVICGPTTIAALLNSLQMGFKSVAIEKRSTEIGKLLQSFVVDFDKFADLLKQTGDKLDKVQGTLSNAEKRTDIIRKKLEKVSKITGDDDPVVESGDSEFLIE